MTITASIIGSLMGLVLCVCSWRQYSTYFVGDSWCLFHKQANCRGDIGGQLNRTLNVDSRVIHGLVTLGGTEHSDWVNTDGSSMCGMVDNNVG